MRHCCSTKRTTHGLVDSSPVRVLDKHRYSAARGQPCTRAHHHSTGRYCVLVGSTGARARDKRTCVAPAPRSSAYRFWNAASIFSTPSAASLPSPFTPPASASPRYCHAGPPSVNVVMPASAMLNSAFIQAVSAVGSSANEALSSLKAACASSSCAVASSNAIWHACSAVSPHYDEQIACTVMQ